MKLKHTQTHTLSVSMKKSIELCDFRNNNNCSMACTRSLHNFFFHDKMNKKRKFNECVHGVPVCCSSQSPEWFSYANNKNSCLNEMKNTSVNDLNRNRWKKSTNFEHTQSVTIWTLLDFFLKKKIYDTHRQQKNKT